MFYFFDRKMLHEFVAYVFVIILFGWPKCLPYHIRHFFKPTTALRMLWLFGLDGVAYTGVGSDLCAGMEQRVI